MATRSMPFWPRPATTSGSLWPGSGLCAPFSGRLSWSGMTRAAPPPHPPEHANSLFHRRPDMLEAALGYLRPEDQLVVWKVDRLGPALREMINTAHDLQQQGVKVLSLTENADTETPNGKLMFNFLGTIAEYFLDLNRERTMEGLKAALARGRKGGRRRKLSKADEAVARAMLADPTSPVAAIAKRLAVSPGQTHEAYLSLR